MVVDGVEVVDGMVVVEGGWEEVVVEVVEVEVEVEVDFFRLLLTLRFLLEEVEEVVVEGLVVEGLEVEVEVEVEVEGLEEEEEEEERCFLLRLVTRMRPLPSNILCGMAR